MKRLRCSPFDRIFNLSPPTSCEPPLTLSSSPALPNEHLRLNTRRRAISDLGSFGSIEVQPRWLPTELQRHILLLALPPLSYTTWNERCLTLKAASLVNKHWRDLAQPELLKHPQFKSAAAIEGYRCAALCAILRADDGLVQRVWTVESLRLRGGGSGWSMGGGLGGMDMVKLDEAWTIKQTHELMIDQSVAASESLAHSPRLELTLAPSQTSRD